MKLKESKVRQIIREELLNEFFEKPMSNVEPLAVGRDAQEKFWDAEDGDDVYTTGPNPVKFKHDGQEVTAQVIRDKHGEGNAIILLRPKTNPKFNWKKVPGLGDVRKKGYILLKMDASKASGLNLNLEPGAKTKEKPNEKKEESVPDTKFNYALTDREKRNKEIVQVAKRFIQKVDDFAGVESVGSRGTLHYRFKIDDAEVKIILSPGQCWVEADSSGAQGRVDATISSDIPDRFNKFLSGLKELKTVIENYPAHKWYDNLKHYKSLRWHKK